MTRNADRKRSGKAVIMLTDLVRSFLKETKDQRKEHEVRMKGRVTEIESLQARAADLTDTINNRPSTVYVLSPATSYANVVASPPNSQPSNIRTIIHGVSGSALNRHPLYTIDTSRAREESPD